VNIGGDSIGVNVKFNGRWEKGGDQREPRMSSTQRRKGAKTQSLHSRNQEVEPRMDTNGHEWTRMDTNKHESNGVGPESQQKGTKGTKEGSPRITLIDAKDGLAEENKGKDTRSEINRESRSDRDRWTCLLSATTFTAGAFRADGVHLRLNLVHRHRFVRIRRCIRRRMRPQARLAIPHVIPAIPPPVNSSWSTSAPSHI
jgi:hypothetical protein